MLVKKYMLVNLKHDEFINLDNYATIGVKTRTMIIFYNVLTFRPYTKLRKGLIGTFINSILRNVQ